MYAEYPYAIGYSLFPVKKETFIYHLHSYYYSNCQVVNRGFMRKELLILLASLIILPSLVNASWGFDYWSDDFYIELYSDGYWHYEDYPHTYYYDSWYYFDYPYRVYYYDTYYYYDAGWYYYEPYWRYNPSDVAYYDYYPDYYYYYGGHWYYEPSWISYYGPTYYGTYYYPPLYAYGSGTGYSYSYPQEAYCDEISIKTKNVSIGAGNEKEVAFWVNNNSNKDFKVKSVSIYIDSFDVRKKNLDYDEYIRAGRSGEITFDLKADADARNDSIDASMKVSGQFTDGTYCSYSGIGEKDFKIYLSGTTDSVPADSSSSESSYNFSYSTARYEAREAEVGWYDVEPETTSTTTTNGQLNNETLEETEPLGNCNGLGLVAENITVQGGESRYKDFYLKNYSNADFYIDSVSVTEYSPAFSAVGIRKDSVVYSESRARVGVKVSGFSGEIDRTGTAYIKVKGHFSSGKTCSLEEKSFYVYVKANKGVSLSSFDLAVPNRVNIDDYGFIEITIDNPTDEEATVKIYGQNIDISPSKITIPAKTYAERVIRVMNLSADKTYVYYSAEIAGQSLLDRFTIVERESEEEIPGEVEEGEEESIELVSYTSRVSMDDRTTIDILLRNESNESKEVRVRIVGLPDEFDSDPVFKQIAPSEEKQISLTVFSNEADSGTYAGILEIEIDGQKIEREILFEVEREEAVSEGETEETKEDEEENMIEGFVSTAFVALGDNAINIGLVIMILILVYLLYKKLAGSKVGEAEQKSSSGNAWKYYKPNFE